MNDRKNKPEREDSILQSKKGKKKEPRYVAECWWSYLWSKEQAFWYEFGSSNQLEEVYSLIDKLIRGSGSGSYGLLKLTDDIPSRTLRILDRRERKIQMVIATKEGSDYSVSKREWTNS